MAKKSFLLIIICVLCFSCAFRFAGSYAYAEYYELDMVRDTLIRKINQFKLEHSKFQPTTVSEDGEIQHYPLDETSEGFYGIYFTIGKDSTILCVINMSDQIPVRPTSMGLVSFCDDERLTNWRRINTDKLTKQENKEIRQLFEKKILDKLGKWKRQ